MGHIATLTWKMEAAVKDSEKVMQQVVAEENVVE